LFCHQINLGYKCPTATTVTEFRVNQAKCHERKEQFYGFENLSTRFLAGSFADVEFLPSDPNVSLVVCGV